MQLGYPAGATVEHFPQCPVRPQIHAGQRTFTPSEHGHRHGVGWSPLGKLAPKRILDHLTERLTPLARPSPGRRKQMIVHGNGGAHDAHITAS